MLRCREYCLVPHSSYLFTKCSARFQWKKETLTLIRGGGRGDRVPTVMNSGLGCTLGRLKGDVPDGSTENYNAHLIQGALQAESDWSN